MPRLIVVMPAKNAESTIGSALRSTLRNLPKDARIVVWNDGSTDNTVDVVQAISDPRIEIIDSPTSVGGGAARAALLRQTDSEFVANMDADDYCLPWRFVVQGQHIGNLDISFTATVKFSDQIKSLKPSNPMGYTSTDVTTSLAFHNVLSHPSMFARREALERAGGYRDLKVAQDYDLWLRAAAAGQKMGRLGLPCIGYRQAGNQVSRQLGYAERIRGQGELLEAYGGFLDSLASGAGRQLEMLVSTTERQAYLKELLTGQLSNFRPVLRAYYARLLQKNRLGPLAAA